VKLKVLILKDKPLFERFLGLRRHALAVYSFENIYIWKAIFKICWAVIDDNLCIFFQDKLSRFLYLPPLGRRVSPGAVRESFRVMDSFNTNKSISRIENIEEGDLGFYRKLRLKLVNKSCDYLCNRRDLAELEGNRFKSKRASLNYFLKHYSFEYLAFAVKYRRDCLKVYQAWEKAKEKVIQDRVYQGMLQDSGLCLDLLLKCYRGLGLIGRLVKIDGEVRAFTFGFRINQETFCILYETTDLKIKGLAQFIFWRFCRELKGYRYINIMDDSGLENLKKVKLSYRPLRLIPAYIAQRPDA